MGGELRFLDFQGGSSSCLMRPHEVLPHVLILGGDHIRCFQFSSVAQTCLTLWDPMNRSMPGFPVNHQRPELAQTHACPSSVWCHPTVSSSVVPFSSCLQFFPDWTQINITWIFVQYISEYVHNICFRIFRIFVFEHVQDTFSSAFT